MHPRSTLRFATLFALPTALLLPPMAARAQSPLEPQPAPIVDPVKGPADPSPLTDVEREMLRTGRPPHTPPPMATRPRATVATATGRVLEQVLTDECGDGRVWAIGNTWKASFGADGFTYVPYFGSHAPRDFPLAFRLQSVHVDGGALPLAEGVPRRAGQQVRIEHGVVTERYELRPDRVEQVFVVDTRRPGAVDVVLTLTSELIEDAGRPGLQFGNEFGSVDYGEAAVVRGDERIPVSTEFANGTLTIHVPASARGDDPLVIDPILSTQPVLTSFPNSPGQPDIAYDATSNLYLLVWHYPFSASDYDVHTEFCSAQGSPLGGTFSSVDSTTISHESPRVAGNNLYDRFLIVMQRYENARWQVWGRLRLVNQPVHPILFPISDPTVPGNALAPDIGGDPAAAGTADNFLVVWQRDLTANESDIHGRIVRIDTSMPGSTLLLENSVGSVFALPNVSNSNGNGFTSQPRWMVVYQNRHSATDWDIYGCVLGQDGSITAPSQAIDVSPQSDVVPFVSSPNSDYAGNGRFLVTYERQGPFEARARLLDENLFAPGGSTNFTVGLGLGAFWVRPECDGNRFVVTHGAASISVSTLVFTGSGWIVQDGPIALPGTAEYPRPCSKRSGGGQRTDHGIVYADIAPAPDRITMSVYEGRAATNGVVTHPLACNGLGIAPSGDNNIGETLTFTMTNVGADIPVFVFGAPTPPSTVICSACPLGVSTNGALLTVGSTLAIPIPPQWFLVGLGFAVQGVAFGSGPCALQFRASDACEFTIR